MDLPSHGEIELALRRLLVDRGNKPLSARQAYEILGDDVFKLSLEQKALMIETADGRERAWHNRCRTARNHLVKAGVMNAGPHNTWALVDSVFLSAPKTPEEMGLFLMRSRHRSAAVIGRTPSCLPANSPDCSIIGLTLATTVSHRATRSAAQNMSFRPICNELHRSIAYH